MDPSLSPMNKLVSQLESSYKELDKEVKILNKTQNDSISKEVQKNLSSLLQELNNTLITFNSSSLENVQEVSSLKPATQQVVDALHSIFPFFPDKNEQEAEETYNISSAIASALQAIEECNKQLADLDSHSNEHFRLDKVKKTDTERNL